MEETTTLIERYCSTNIIYQKSPTARKVQYGLHLEVSPKMGQCSDCGFEILLSRLFKALVQK
jgi:hypothetical protein